MAILKYTNSNGETVTLNAYKVNNVMVKNEKGNSETDTMSQKVITDELNNKLSNFEIEQDKSSVNITVGNDNETNRLYINCADNFVCGVMSPYDKAKLDELPTYWRGTQEEYDAIDLYNDNIIYLITE